MPAAPSNDRPRVDECEIAHAFNRQASLNSILVLATDPGAMARLIKAINENRSLGLSAVSEKEYYAKQTSSGALLEEAGIFIALIMAVGSSLSVPRTALRDQGVFLVADGKAVYRKVRVETASWNTVLVAEGLQEGDQVIVNPPADLKERTTNE